MMDEAARNADASAHPATRTVHWPTGPVRCCDDHAEKLVGLGRFMGTHVYAEPYSGEEPCSNCVNAARKSRK